MSDKMAQYFDAYYGTPIPASQANVIREPFVKMVQTIQTDIENHIPHASKDAVKEGLLEAMRYMHSTGQVDTPTLYLRNTRIATEAFRYAIAATNGKPLKRQRSEKEIADALKRERDATKAMLDEDEKIAKEKSENSPIAAELYREYNKLKAIHLKNGDAPRDAKVKAYMQLVEIWNYQVDFDFYIVAMQIPLSEGIYYETEVINTMNAHPILSGMDRKYPVDKDPADKGMRVNGKSWKGLSG